MQKCHKCVKQFLIEHNIFTKRDIEKLISEFKQSAEVNKKFLSIIISITFFIFPLALNDSGSIDVIKLTNILQQLSEIALIGFLLFIMISGIKNFVQAIRCKFGIKEEIINILNDLYYEAKN